jgi:hypothetical protein
LDAFKANLGDRLRMIAVSQLAASAVTHHLNADTLGIIRSARPVSMSSNRWHWDQEQYLVHYLTMQQKARTDTSLPSEVIEDEGYAFGLEQFQLHATRAVGRHQSMEGHQ